MLQTRIGWNVLDHRLPILSSSACWYSSWWWHGWWPHFLDRKSAERKTILLIPSSPRFVLFLIYEFNDHNFFMTRPPIAVSSYSILLTSPGMSLFPHLSRTALRFDQSGQNRISDSRENREKPRWSSWRKWCGSLPLAGMHLFLRNQALVYLLRSPSTIATDSLTIYFLIIVVILGPIMAIIEALH